MTHRLSVVVPAYREAGRIGHTVERLRDALVSEVAPRELEIVVVDDGSPDDTAGAAQAAGADRTVRLPANRGKGGAVRAGVLASDGAAVAFTDADLAYPPSQLMRLLHEVESGVDMVVGSRRHINTTTLVRTGRVREVSGRVFNLITRLALAGRWGDTQCGLKAFSRPAAEALFTRARLDGFAFDVELFLLAERMGLSIREVPVELAPVQGTTVALGSDALQMVGDVLRLRRWAASGAYDAPERHDGAAEAGR